MLLGFGTTYNAMLFDVDNMLMCSTPAASLCAHRLTNGSHVELLCNEVKGLEGRRLAKQLASAAQRWFDSLVAEPHSFTKPMFYLGLETWTVSNIIAEGAHERTPGSIKLFANGASGFRDLGDRMCFKVEVRTRQTLHHVKLEVTATWRVPKVLKRLLQPSRTRLLKSHYLCHERRKLPTAYFVCMTGAARIHA